MPFIRVNVLPKRDERGLPIDAPEDLLPGTTHGTHLIPIDGIYEVFEYPTIMGTDVGISYDDGDTDPVAVRVDHSLEEIERMIRMAERESVTPLTSLMFPKSSSSGGETPR